MSNLKYIFLGISTVLVFVAAVVFDLILTAPQILPALNGGSLSDAENKAIDIVVTRANLITNWNMAAIGAVIYIFLRRTTFKLTKTVYFYLISSLLLSVTSIYFSQLLLDITSRTLIAEQNPFYNNNLQMSMMVQYISSLVALFLLVGATLNTNWANE